MKKNLIGIHGKKGHGKDAVAKIIQFLTKTESPEYTTQNFVEELASDRFVGSVISKWEILSYGDKLKQCCAILLGCTVEELNNREFKYQIIPEQWWFFKNKITEDIIPYTPKRLKNLRKDVWKLHKPTYRWFMQHFGTNAVRNNIHPDAWVISTFNGFIPHSDNWILSDVRFPNELQAIVNRGGLKIKVVRHKPASQWADDYSEYFTILDPDGFNRSDYEYSFYQENISQDEFLSKLLRCTVEFKKPYEDFYDSLKHDSEISLDDYEDWDYVILNDGDIWDLIEKVKHILIKEKII